MRENCRITGKEGEDLRVMKVKSIRNIRIKTKLLFLGGVSILGLVFIGAESIITARQINQASN